MCIFYHQKSGKKDKMRRVKKQEEWVRICRDAAVYARKLMWAAVVKVDG
jgi:hypothetical protein